MPPLSDVDGLLAVIDHCATTSPQCRKSPLSPLTTSKSLLSELRRTVSFAPSAHIRHVSHIEDYSANEIEATWYSQQEYKLMKYDIRGTVKMMARSERLAIDQCTRGLEHKTKEGMQRKMFNQIESISAVMDEQDRQARDGIRDETLIARAYMVYTVHCTAMAHYMALSDQRIAAIEEEEGDDIHRSSAIAIPNRQKRRLSCTAA
jgi:hypothetical protein